MKKITASKIRGSEEEIDSFVESQADNDAAWDAQIQVNMSEVVVTLPDNLAQEVEANGLPKPEFLVSLLSDEIRRRRINKLFAAADRLADLGVPITEAEVEAEIAATREGKSTC